MTDQPGLGDSQPPLDAKMVNVTVTGERRPRVGAREIENGKLQHRMLRGSMKPKEIVDIVRNMDQAAHLYNEEH